MFAAIKDRTYIRQKSGTAMAILAVAAPTPLKKARQNQPNYFKKEATSKYIYNFMALTFFQTYRLRVEYQCMWREER